MQAIVWLGAYNRAATAPCAFERHDDWIKEKVAEVAGHEAIVAYQIADEPDAAISQCPGTVEAIADRAALVRSLDPAALTYVTISRTGATYERWKAVDVLGVVVYPVSSRGYNETLIPEAIEALTTDDVSEYWAVIQDFGTPDWYVLPSASQLERQFDQWATSAMSGYMIYHWSKSRLDDRPDHLEVIEQINTSVA
jgi:hypothetical protein